MDCNQLLRLVARCADDKKALDIVILDLQNISLIADYFVICSGSSVTQVKAIVDYMEEQSREQGIKPHHIEGYNEGRWILADFGSVVAHVFQEQERHFYNLERLWSEAKQYRFPSE